MLSRKKMKQQARQSLKKHYTIFLAVCLIAAFLGTEFSDSLKFLKSYSPAAGQAAPSGAVTVQKGIVDVTEDLFLEGTKKAKKKSEEIKKEEVNASKHGNPAFGRSRGVFAEALNAVTSGSIIVTLASGLNSFLGSTDAALAVLLVMSIIIVCLFWIFIVNTYRVISRRIFLEGRIYSQIPAQRFLYLLKIRKWANAAKTMLLTAVYQTLWGFTVIGGLIKKYSYYLVPYIVAENPGIGSRDAILLSRKIMDGHKWQCFVFELSFIGWKILETATLGLSGILYSSPYKTAVFCEYYIELRREAKEKQMEHADLLNDRYLYEKAADKEIERVYGDVIPVLEQTHEFRDRRSGIGKFLSDHFGIILVNSKAYQDYEQYQAELIQIQDLGRAVERKAYPGRLSAIPEHAKRKRIETLHYMRNYTVWSLIMIYFSLSFIGWLWEVSLHLISDGSFVNRGVLHGPWLPIYGVGSVLILTILHKMRSRPVSEFFCAVVLCGCVEYFTSVFLEFLHHGQRWWDYSGYFLNIHGRVCAEGLLVFGLGGIAIVYFLAPIIDNLTKKMKPNMLVVLCMLLLGAFFADQAYSGQHPNAGKGITDYSRLEGKFQKN